MTIQAIELFRSAPRYLTARAIGDRAPGFVSGPIAPLRLVNKSEPELPGPGWARVRPLLSGICGSDLATISGKSSFYFSPLVSMPFVPGHEVVGELLEDLDDLVAGQRVVLSPVLGCPARGVEPWCENCKNGDFGRCDRVTSGHISPGLQTGYCKDTGGGWSKMFVAHRSQLVRVPDDMTNECAVLVEPLACSVHAGYRADIRPNADVLIIGAGSIGLLTLLAIRELGVPADDLVAPQDDERSGQHVEPLTSREQEILTLLGQGHTAREIAEQLTISKYKVQQSTQAFLRKLGVHSRLEAVARMITEKRRPPAVGPAGSITVAAKYLKQRIWAEAFGATEVVDPADVLNGIRRDTRAMRMKPERGGPYLLGGVDVTIDCVGSRSSLDLALRVTKAGGRVVLAGIPTQVPDLTPVWFRELELVGAYTGGVERAGEHEAHAFDLAVAIASRNPLLDRMVGATYPLKRWREAIDHAMSAGRMGTLKVAFDPRQD
jgi:threonine dehydrogenase-like Zn-dependent dehydrogenase